MKEPFLSGEKIYLRELCEDDAEGNYLKWLNDSEVTRYLEIGYFPSNMQSLKEYINKNSNDSCLFLAIVEKDSDKHIGNIKLDWINWIHRTAYIGIIIGEKDYHGKGYAKEAIKLVVDHAFNKLNLRKICLGVAAENVSAVKVYEKCGFEIEGVQKEDRFYNGQYCDIILMAIMKNGFKGAEEK